jgi:hypothetical protein
MNGIRIDIQTPRLSIEEQLVAYSHEGKCVMGFFDDQGQFISYWNNLSYMEKLFVIDSFKKLLSMMLEK